MKVWKLAVPFVAGLASLYATGCATEERVVIHHTRPAPVQVREAPPPEQVEVVPAAPRADYIWIKGNWHWNGARWVWIAGHYEAQRVGARWVPAHYETRGGTYFYVPGHWAAY
jgi:hypothetical protein